MGLSILSFLAGLLVAIGCLAKNKKLLLCGAIFTLVVVLLDFFK